MYIVDLIKRNGILVRASLLLIVLLSIIFVVPSTCNEAIGWGLCYTEDAKAGQKNIYLSPFNYILPPPPDWMRSDP